MAWAWVIAAQLETASRWLAAAESASNQLEPKDADTIQGHVAAHRAYIVLMQGRYPQSIDFAQRALELLPHCEAALRVRSITYLGNAYNYSGRLQEAKNAFGEAIEIAQKTGSLSLEVFGYGGLGEVFRDEGQLDKAMDAYQQLLRFAKDLSGSSDGPLTGYARLEVGVIFKERHELDEAIEHLRKGVNQCREWRQGEALAIGLLELAETHRIRGEYAQAEEAIQEVRQVAADISPWATNLVEGFAARLALSRGEIKEAVRWVERSGLDEESCEIGYERFSECLPLIRTRIATGNPRRALALTERLIERDRAFGRMGRVLDLLVLQVAALDAMKQPDRALKVLAEAVELAGPQKHVRPFVDEGPRLTPYLRKLPPSPYRDRLLKIFAPSPPEPTLPEPLSEREIQVLRLMAGGLSNREIADEMFLSVNTIRWYASQLYGKLNVKRRGEAVARAQELGIL
jgi:LuxR family maltose regulon positive regulatory protein